MRFLNIASVGLVPAGQKLKATIRIKNPPAFPSLAEGERMEGERRQLLRSESQIDPPQLWVTSRRKVGMGRVARAGVL